MFELSQIRCFVAAAEELHFGRAAARLNMTQPPLSRQIQLLERILGVSLMTRTTRDVKLTPAGRIFLVEARRIIRLSESATLLTRRVASGEAGRITIGFTAASGYGFLPSLIEIARRRVPDVDLSLREMVTGEQIEGLLTGGIDIGLLRPPVNRPEFHKMHVVSEPLLAALQAGDPRLAKPVLTLEDFDGKDMIMYSPQGAGYFYDMLTTMFDEAGVRPVQVQHMSQIHSMLALVHSGIGSAIVPHAASRLHFDDVEFRPLQTHPVEPVELLLAWRGDTDNPSMPLLLKALAAEMGPAA
jgi:DNA-binding transcriptional LysR family regulator